MSLKLMSTAFRPGEMIPDQYSRKGGNLSPPITWSGVPVETQSLALVVDDPDAPSGLFVHWLVYDIPPGEQGLAEGQPAAEELANGERQGRNGFGDVGYGGPQPPSGTHRYFFHLYALDTELSVPAKASRNDLDAAIRGHVLEETELMGRYGR